MKRFIALIITGILELFLPQMAECGSDGLQMFYRDLAAAMVPVFSYNEETLQYEEVLVAEMELENRKLQEKSEVGNSLLPGERSLMEPLPSTEEAIHMETEQTEDIQQEEQNTLSQEQTTEKPEQTTEKPEQITEHVAETQVQEPLKEAVNTNEVLLEKLEDFDYLIQNYYIVDSSTTVCSDDLRASELLTKDLTVNMESDGAQILIYHTHSQEGYANSVEGNASTSVVALGEYLTTLLTEKYHFKVLHHTGEYDVGDRDHAYSNAAPSIQKILEENPSIEVVIDLHRDSVAESTHLVTDINGKKTAKIMFFNGLCRTTAKGDLLSLPNPYLKDNLAFSLQMQIAAANRYPDFTRRIYLKGYRYNMHFCPKSLLVEVGAQNNTLEEGMNAMEPLAELLFEVLQ